MHAQTAVAAQRHDPRWLELGRTQRRQKTGRKPLTLNTVASRTEALRVAKAQAMWADDPANYSRPSTNTHCISRRNPLAYNPGDAFADR